MGKNTKKGIDICVRGLQLFIYLPSSKNMIKATMYHILNSGVSFAIECFKVLNKQGPSTCKILSKLKKCHVP